MKQKKETNLFVILRRQHDERQQKQNHSSGQNIFRTATFTKQQFFSLKNHFHHNLVILN